MHTEFGCKTERDVDGGYYLLIRWLSDEAKTAVFSAPSRCKENADIAALM
jgi:hypothetical protein